MLINIIQDEDNGEWVSFDNPYDYNIWRRKKKLKELIKKCKNGSSI